ncbi:MAG: SDR family oxidoreductase [Lachnospiraceae bacterium]|nr:SDR family oxidoreductase [Lachnospiraceae bacterium]
MSDFSFEAPTPQPIDDLLSLTGKVAIVTGGSRGIGRQVLNRFAEAGAKVVFTGRHLEGLQEVEKELTEKGYDVACFQADVSNVEDSRKTVDFSLEKYGRLDIVVNNAASFPFCDARAMTEDVWDKCFDIDAKGTFFMSQIAAESMIKQGDGGRIINFMSTAALAPTGPLIAYGAAKQAVWYCTRTMAQTYAPNRITVNAVTPGATMTEERVEAFSGNFNAITTFVQNSGNADSAFVDSMTSMVEGDNMDTFKNLFEQMLPMGRFGFPDDLARAVLFLASDMASYVTGQNITVDGAQSLQTSMVSASQQFMQGAEEEEPAGENDSEEQTTSSAPTNADATEVKVDGTWSSHLNSPMGEGEVTFKLAADGGNVSGTVNFMDNEINIEKGSVSGNQVSFSFKMKAAMMKVDVSVTGSVNEDQMTGEIKMRMGSMPFTAIRS